MKPQKLRRTTILCLLILPILILVAFSFSSRSTAQVGVPRTSLPAAPSGQTTPLADPTAVWLDVVESSIAAPPGTRRIVPKRYRTVAINRAAFTNILGQRKSVVWERVS